ncbi:condensin-2 complex subunit D3 [Camelus ferus]|nr:condensin-2 complex subunit D3 [Camelus ferus]
MEKELVKNGKVPERKQLAADKSSQSVWTFFIENNISHGALVALFHHFVQVVHKKSVSVQHREFGLHAAGLYFLLLEVPGSVANQVFHPVMFDKCIQILKRSWPQESSSSQKRKKEQPKNSQANPRGSRKRGKLPRKEDMEVFVALTNFEPVLHEFHVTQARNLDEAKYIPELAYRGLYLLCSPIHGEGDKVISCVFHQMLNIILMLEVGEGSHRTPLAITSPVISSRNQAVRFISSLVDELKESVFPVLHILLQHICAKVIDKSEYRTHAAQSLVQLLSKLPCGEYAAFIAWLYRYSRSSKIPHRVFTLDVALALLELPEREVDSTLRPEQHRFLKHKFLVQDIMFARCLDKAPTVRSKALSSFAHCLEFSVPSASESVLELLVNSSTISGIESHHDTLPKHSSESCVMAMLRKRAQDEKANVRRSALQVLVSILKHCDVSGMKEELSILQDRCRDPTVSVRKQALQSLTELLTAQPHCIQIQKAWLVGAVPVVMDCESTVQDKALECLDQLLLQNIRHHSQFHPGDDGQVLAWALLALLSTESREMSRYLNKAFHIWAKKDKFSSAFVNNVLSHAGTEHSAPAWMLLAKVAGSAPALDYTRIIKSWEKISSQQSPSADTLGHILCVIGHIAKHLPQSTRDKVTDVVKGKLNGFQWSLELISSAVDTLQSLCRASAETPLEEQELLVQVCGDVLSSCVCCLSNVVLKEDGAGRMDEDLVVKYIFTLGDIAQLCPASVDKRAFLLIQSILAASASADCLTPGPGSSEAPASQPLSQVQGSVMPSVIRAHAVITLGKLCLQHEDLAKKSVPALVRELEVCEDAAVRSNVVIVLCDLCIRYTVMVDKYIPNISMCLKDPDAFVRKQTLLLLTNLLQEDFVKWKGSLFFRFVSTLTDPHPDIASLGEFCLAHLLLKRSPTTFFQHFIECIFHFSSYEKHEKYNRFPQSEREKQLFSLKGKTNKEKRMKIYRFLLEHFTDEQRFNMTSKLCLGILACFADGTLPLDMEANELLSDTFEVLSSKEIKLLAMRSKPDKDLLSEEDDLALANAVMQEAQKKLISQIASVLLQVQKRNFIENIIPIIISLKTVLEKNKMPALRELMNYLREVMQDYRDEVKDFFALDKQLASELEYDMKRHREQLAQEQEQALARRPSMGAQGAQAVQVGRTEFGNRAGRSWQRWRLTRSRQPTPRPRATREANAQSQVCGPRLPVSLSTIAVLNSVRRAVELSGQPRSRSAGLLPSSVRPRSPGEPSNQASSQGLEQESSGAIDRVTNRAISTPEQKMDAQSHGDDILCLSLPDKPPPQPPQWNQDVLLPEKKPQLAHQSSSNADLRSVREGLSSWGSGLLPC